MQSLQAGHSEVLTEYLGAMAKFHTYSFGNIMLIARQKPSASNVAGVRTWNSLGRFVRRGEKGILILASLGLFFSKHLTLSAGWGFFWRESSSDGLYGIPGNLIVPSNGLKSRYEGSRPIGQLDWQMTRHLSTHVNYIYVFNLSFEEESIHATTSMSYISPWLTYRF